jgi:hypothetical protein
MTNNFDKAVRLAMDGGHFHPITQDTENGMEGITVRQYYKAAALTGLLANWGSPDLADYVHGAEVLADLMLAEDEAHGKGKNL